MAGQALTTHDVASVIHSHRVKHALCDIDPEDIHFLLHWTRLLWLNGFTDLELIVAHCRRSAQGRVHFIMTICGVQPIVADTSPLRKPQYDVDATMRLRSREARW